MPYTKQTWTANVTPVTAARMNYIEDGIFNAGIGVELDYVEAAASLTVTATTEATGQTFVTSSSVTYDGSTKIAIECFSPAISMTNVLFIALWEDSTSLGRLGAPAGTGSNVNENFYAKVFRTPTAGAHVYSVRCSKNSGTAVVQGNDTGGNGFFLLHGAYIRITKA